MNNYSSKLSPIQIFALCSASSALGTLCFAPLLGNGADVSWAAAIIIAAVFSTAAAAFYIKVLRSSVCTALNDCSGNFICRLLLLVLGILFIAEAALTAFVTTDAVEMYLLEETPNEVVLLALLITACVVFDAGKQYLARCCVILLLISVIPLTILITLSLFNSDPGELSALLQPDAAAVIRHLPAAFLSCSGGGAFVIFASGVQDKKNLTSAVYGFIASAAASLLLFACSVGIFTADGAELFKYPYIEMARSVSVGTIALTERFDIILLSVMIIAVIMQLAVFAYCAAFCFGRSAGFRSHRCFTFLLIPVIFAAAYYSDNEALFNLLAQISFRGTAALMLGIVPFLLILLGLRKRRATNA